MVQISMMLQLGPKHGMLVYYVDEAILVNKIIVVDMVNNYAFNHRE